MKNILFLTAYSDHSKNVYKYALKLAQQLDAGITLCHIYKEGSSSETAKNESAQAEKLRAFASDHVEKMKKVVPIKIEVGHGDFVDYISKLEKTLAPDLIVMGMTRKKYSDKVFGSLSLKMIKQSKAPVLLIPPEAKMEAIKNIVYASYLSSSDDEKAIGYLKEWTSAFSANLEVLCICEKHNMENSKAKLEKLKALAIKDDPDLTVKFQLKEGNKNKIIETYREFTKADLLVIATHRSGFWASLFEPAITQQIASETVIPLLVLKQ